jgi:hypothetical protein
MSSELETRIIALEASNSHRDERIAALEGEINELTQLMARNIVDRAAAIVAARITPTSPDMAKTGRSENPQAIDTQEILLRSRSGERKANPPSVPGYGRRV